MADIKRIKAEIAELAERPKQVRFSEIERIVNQLDKAGYSTRHRRTKESNKFVVASVPFMVCSHNKGSHLKQCYVHEFLDAMEELGLYGEGAK